MKDEQLNRILRLIKKTNDKFVVLDKASDDAHMIMSLDSYEDLIDGNELDSGGSVPPIDPENGDDNFAPDTAQDDSSDAEPDFSNLEIIKDELPEHRDAPRATEPLDFSGNWATHNTAAPVEESLADVPHEEEEEKFYLEPVE